MVDDLATYQQGALSAPAGTPYFPSPALQQSVLKRGIQSFGQPYFAFWKQINDGAFAGFSSDAGSTSVAALVVALDGVPVMHASPDEPHWLLSLHGRESGREAFSIGVTPSLRICAQVNGGNILYSLPGAIAADHAWRFIQLTMTEQSTLELRVDGLVVATYQAGLGVTLTTGTAFGAHFELGRVMLFNGGNGLTRCACSIYGAGYVLPASSVAWPLTEGSGATLFPSATLNLWGTALDLIGGGNAIVPEPDPNPPPPVPPAPIDPTIGPWGNMALYAGWFDPAPGQPDPYPFTVGDISKAYQWLARPPYRKGGILSPAYLGAPGAVTEYDPATGVQIDATPIDVVHTNFTRSGPAGGGFTPTVGSQPGIYNPFPKPRKT